MSPILKFKLEQTGFNEFKYRVMKIEGFPTESEIRLYCKEDGDYIFMRENCNYKALVFENSSVGPKLLIEGEIANHIRDEADLMGIYNKLYNHMKWFAGIVDMHNEHIKNVGKEITMDFSIPSKSAEQLKREIREVKASIDSSDSQIRSAEIDAIENR